MAARLCLRIKAQTHVWGCLTLVHLCTNYFTRTVCVPAVWLSRQIESPNEVGGVWADVSYG